MCCEKKGFVYLSNSDVDWIAVFLRISKARFESKYLYRTKNLQRFRKPRHGQCPFLSAQGCSIHAVKPTQCRTFPLWPEIVDDTKELADTAQWCPGIGKGPHVRVDEIRACTEQMRNGYPHMYDKG